MSGESQAFHRERSLAVMTERNQQGAELVDIAVRHTSLRANLLAVLQFHSLIRHLVLKDLKLKYRGSLLGFVWSLLNPLVMLLVYTIAFKYIMGVRTGGFVFLLLLGILAWTFFATSASMSAGAIVDNRGLLKTVFFPRPVLPIASVLFNLAQFLLTAVVFVPVLSLIFHVRPGWPALLFPVFVVLQVLMTIGVALMLATGTAYFRDLRHLLEITLAVMFWTTPIVYDFHAIPLLWQRVVLFSPMSPFVLAYQEILFHVRWPGPEVWAVAILYAFGAFFGGVLLFTRCQDEFLERI
jgi:ABC-2 type transport system permease protein